MLSRVLGALPSSPRCAPAARFGGPLVVAGAVALFLLALGLRDWYWPPFGVPGSTGFSFLDVRYFTSAWDCARAGIDIADANPCDPLGRPLNYPRLWLAPAYLGLGQGATVLLGAGLAVVFLAAVAAVVGRVDAWDGVVYAAALCSPSVLLGIERGNPDLLVFALVVGGVLLLRAGPAWVRATAHAVFLLAAMLKLYPVLAWGPLVRQPRVWLVRGLGAVAAVLAVYAVVTWDDVRAIQRLAPRDVIFSYGAGILGDEIGGRAVVVAAGALGAALLVLAARRRHGRLPASPARAQERRLDLFWVGAAVFAGTYVSTHNYNYRLAFLLLTLPQLLHWSREARPAVPFPALGLTAVLAVLWLGASLAAFPLGIGAWWEDVSAAFPYDELVTLVLFAYLAGALALTLPRGLRTPPR
jgi:hypothetical protein